MSGILPDWRSRLDRLHGTDVRIRAVTRDEPVVDVAGTLALGDEAQGLAREFRRTLAVNDAVAVVDAAVAWDTRPLHLPAARTDYAAVCALSRLGPRPTMLSANVLLLCVATRQVVLHRRSAMSRDFAGQLHTFGGVYQPPVDGAQGGDGSSLLHTARREIAEEIGVAIDFAALPPLLLCEELNVGFVNLGVLGVPIDAAALAQARGNHEGAIECIGFDALPQRLSPADWAEAGRVQLLAWLALGAPAGGAPLHFDGLTGPQLFDHLVP